jgi:hypothetical protein
MGDFLRFRREMSTPESPLNMRPVYGLTMAEHAQRSMSGAPIKKQNQYVARLTP